MFYYLSPNILLVINEKICSSNLNNEKRIGAFMKEFQNNEINRILYAHCTQVGDNKIKKTMLFQIATYLIYYIKLNMTI